MAETLTRVASKLQDLRFRTMLCFLRAPWEQGRVLVRMVQKPGKKVRAQEASGKRHRWMIGLSH